MNSNCIIGHQHQRQRLQQLLLSGRLPSTLMFCGPIGTGKHLIARELYRSLFCETGVDNDHDRVYGGCGTCRACHLFDIGNFPDFYQIDCLDRDAAKVEELRSLLYNLSLKSFAGQYRAVLFDNAEQLSLQGANLLLKALEEPRPGVFFCLVASNPAKLPITLRSRCHVWFFDALAEHEIQQIIEKSTEQRHDLSCGQLAILADGSMENVDSLNMLSEQWKQISSQLSLIADGDVKTAADLASKLSKDRANLREMIRLLRIYSRTKMLSSKLKTDQAKWAVMLSNLLAAEQFIFERNLNASYLLSLLFCQLAADSSQPGKLIEEIVV